MMYAICYMYCVIRLTSPKVNDFILYMIMIKALPMVYDIYAICYMYCVIRLTSPKVNGFV